MTQVSDISQQVEAEASRLAESLETQAEVARDRERWVGKLRLLWNERGLLFRWAATGLAVALLLAFLIPKRYQSTTQLMPPDSQSTSGIAMLAALSARVGNGMAGYAGDLLGMKSTGALFVGVLQSQTVRERLVQRFDLRKVYGERQMLDAEKKLTANTSISEDRKSGIITIVVTDRSPQRAAAIAGGYAEELDRIVAQLSTSAAHRERVFLEERLKAVKHDLDDAAEKFGQFASNNTAIDIKEQGRAMVEAAATLQGHLIAAESELEMLKQVYTDNNVRIRAARARIGELQRQLDILGGKGVHQADRTSSVVADPLYPSIRQLPLLGITYADLFRRTKIEETVYEVLTQQYELAKVEEAKETPSVKVLDPARVPEKKSFPPRLLIMFVGATLTVALAVAWVLGHALWEETDPQDARKLFAQDVFATVKAEMSWAARYRLGLHAATSKFVSRFRQQQDPREGPK